MNLRNFQILFLSFVCLSQITQASTFSEEEIPLIGEAIKNKQFFRPPFNRPCPSFIMDGNKRFLASGAHKDTSI